MSKVPRLKAIGFWRRWGRPRCYPSPRWLVDRRWCPEERARLAHYLRSGLYVTGYLGFSACRFGCRVEPEVMGSCELSDGEWVWPEGLAHYVEVHSVRLPEPFVARARENNWTIPIEPTEWERLRTEFPECDYDFESWEKWGRSRRPWYVFW